MRTKILHPWAALLGMSCLAAPTVAHAQTVTDGNYIIARTTGTYQSIVGVAGVNVVFGNGSAISVDDQVSAAIPLGFNFSMYGNSFTTASVGSNGYIALPSTTSTTFSNTALASLGSTGLGAANFIAPYWDDLFFTANQPGALLTLTRPSTGSGTQEFVVEYDRVAYFSAQTTTMSFQAILRDDGSMAFYYPDVSGPAGQSNGASATIGVRGASGVPTQGAEWSFNTASVNNGDLLTLTPVTVPEPTSMTLAGMGLLGFLAQRRRRRNSV